MTTTRMRGTDSEGMMARRVHANGPWQAPPPPPLHDRFLSRGVRWTHDEIPQPLFSERQWCTTASEQKNLVKYISGAQN